MLLGIAFLPFVLWALYLVQKHDLVSYRIASESMEPAYNTGEVWLMENTNGVYKIGDAVVFPNPNEQERTVVKRIVALESDNVEEKEGLLYINGKPAPPPQGKETPSGYVDRKWTIKPGQAFVAGDNRENSVDSRDYGPIQLKTIKGALRRRLNILEK